MNCKAVRGWTQSIAIWRLPFGQGLPVPPPALLLPPNSPSLERQRKPRPRRALLLLLKLLQLFQLLQLNLFRALQLLDLFRALR